MVPARAARKKVHVQKRFEKRKKRQETFYLTFKFSLPVSHFSNGIKMYEYIQWKSGRNRMRVGGKEEIFRSEKNL